MVKYTKFWDIQLDKAIKKTKIRIKQAEKHGIGNAAIAEKKILQKQERSRELRK